MEQLNSDLPLQLLLGDRAGNAWGCRETREHILALHPSPALGSSFSTARWLSVFPLPPLCTVRRNNSSGRPCFYRPFSDDGTRINTQSGDTGQPDFKTSSAVNYTI